MFFRIWNQEKTNVENNVPGYQTTCYKALVMRLQAVSNLSPELSLQHFKHMLSILFGL